MPMSSRLLRPLAGRAQGFLGGNLAANSLYDAALAMASGSPIAPAAGGTLTINGEALGSYDYAIRSGETLSSFTAADWFTNTADTRSAWCVVRGDLTINSGVTFTPPVRKLFSVLVVTGDLTVNGTVSMTARGANHSGTGNSGGATTARDIRIFNGTISGVTNPQVPAAGGAGGARRTGAGNFSGNAGTDGSGGGSGGGGGGAFNSGAAIQSGAGSAGTSFSGGGGGGGTAGFNTGADAVANGGAGGLIACQSGFSGGGSGAGNPAGVVVTAANSSATAGQDGTGGTLVIIVLGQLLGSGAIQSNGSAGGVNANSSGSGGSSGGGSVTVISGTDVSSITTQANGGTTGIAGGGLGGAGTARRLRVIATEASNAEAQDWINRVYANGGTVSASTANAVNAFCNAIDSAGIRDRFWRLNLFCGDQLAAALVPLYRGPVAGGTVFGGTNDASVSLVSGDYTATGSGRGMRGGTGKAVDTGLLHPTIASFLSNHHLAACTASAWPSGAPTIMGYDNFVTAAPNGIYFRLRALSGSAGFQASQTDFNLTAASPASPALWIGTANNGSVALYSGGTSRATGSQTQPVTDTIPAPISSVYVLGGRRQSTPAPSDVLPNTAPLCAYSMGVSMTAAQASAYNDAMKSFQSALGQTIA